MMRPIWLAVLIGCVAIPAAAQSALERADPVEIATAEEEPAAAKPEKPVLQPAARSRATKPAPTSPDPVTRADPRSASLPGTDLSPAERALIQTALAWSGDTGDAADGDAFTAAIKAFQKRIDAAVTGVLTPEQSARLLAAARSRENDYGWQVVHDAGTGVRLGLPGKTLPLQTAGAEGTRWSSRHGDVQLETFRLTNGLSLAALYQMERNHIKRRRVEYSQINGDGFLLSGTQGLRRFVMRTQAKAGEIRGFLLQYDQALEVALEPVATATSNSFVAFPADGMMLASAPNEKVVYGSAVAVSADGYFVTARKLTENCASLVAAGLGPAERIAEDGELALLRVFGARGLVSAAIANRESGGDVTVRGIPEPAAQDGGRAEKRIAASLQASSLHLSAPADRGFTGGGAFNADGTLAGIVSVGRPVFAAAGGGTQIPMSQMTPANMLRDFLANRVAVAVHAGKREPTVARLICVRE